MKNILAGLRKPWVITLIALVIIGGYFYFRKGTVSETPATRPQVAAIERGDLNIVVSGSGQIQAESQVDLKPVVAGDAIEVIAVSVRNDQEVMKRQVIAVLDNKDALRNIQRAELDLRKAKIQQQQTDDLNPAEIRADVRERQLAATAVQQSEVALQEARERLNDYIIRAPFDGIVTGLAVESGDTVSQTSTLASVITRAMKVVITLNEVDAAQVKVGNSANLSFDALPNERVPGKITKIDTIGVAEQGVVSYGAEITLDEQNPNLKPGMSVAAEISLAEKKNVLLVPNAAITYEDNKTYVWIASAQAENDQRGGSNIAQGDPTGGRQRKEITAGLTDNVKTEVVSGLNEGDRVLVMNNNGGEAAPGGETNQQGSNRSGIFNLFRGGGGSRGGGVFNH